jgi:hypothetical protein
MSKFEWETPEFPKITRSPVYQSINKQEYNQSSIKQKQAQLQNKFSKCPSHNLSYQPSSNKFFRFTSIRSVEEKYNNKQLNLRQRDEVIYIIKTLGEENIQGLNFTVFSCPICRRSSYLPREFFKQTEIKAPEFLVISFNEMISNLKLIYSRSLIASYISIVATFNIFFYIVGFFTIPNPIIGVFFLMFPGGGYYANFLLYLSTGTIRLNYFASGTLYCFLSFLIIVPSVKSVKFFQSTEIIPVGPQSSLRNLVLPNLIFQIIVSIFVASFIIAPLLIILSPNYDPVFQINMNDSNILFLQLFFVLIVFLGLLFVIPLSMIAFYYILELGSLDLVQIYQFGFYASIKEAKKSLATIGLAIAFGIVWTTIVSFFDTFIQVVSYSIMQAVFLFYLSSILSSIALNYLSYREKLNDPFLKNNTSM